MTLSLSGPLLLVGAGKMGGAMLEGWLDRGMSARQIFVQDPAPSADMVSAMRRRSIVFGEQPALPSEPAVIILAVKPQIMADVAPGIAPQIGACTVVLSVAAGQTLGNLETYMGRDKAIIRAMPNTPAAIRRGITVACANDHVTPSQKAACTALLEAVGEAAWIEDEGLMDAVTAVSGSGPAYIFLLAEMLAKAGIKAGLDEALARRLADVTVSGAGALIAVSDDDPAQLRRNVTSPGGTTKAALDVLMAQDGLEALLSRAVEAAARRSRELAED